MSFLDQMPSLPPVPQRLAGVQTVFHGISVAARGAGASRTAVHAASPLAPHCRRSARTPRARLCPTPWARRHCVCRSGCRVISHYWVTVCLSGLSLRPGRCRNNPIGFSWQFDGANSSSFEAVEKLFKELLLNLFSIGGVSISPPRQRLSVSICAVKVRANLMNSCVV